MQARKAKKDPHYKTHPNLQESQLTWILSCTFSISTPRNFDLTSKMPTSSVDEISNVTFLNLVKKGPFTHVELQIYA